MSDNTGTGATPDATLMGIAATLAEIKTDQRSQSHTLTSIEKDIRNFGERLVALELRSDQMKDDITRRTHTEETNRVKVRMDTLEHKMSDKVGVWFARTVVGILVTEFMVVIGGVTKLVFFP